MKIFPAGIQKTAMPMMVTQPVGLDPNNLSSISFAVSSNINSRPTEIGIYSVFLVLVPTAAEKSFKKDEFEDLETSFDDANVDANERKAIKNVANIATNALRSKLGKYIDSAFQDQQGKHNEYMLFANLWVDKYAKLDEQQRLKVNDQLSEGTVTFKYEKIDFQISKMAIQTVIDGLKAAGLRYSPNLGSLYNDFQ